MINQTMKESAKPKGFPSSSTRRLKPIKTRDLKHSELTAISRNLDIKPMNSDIIADCGYKSDFGVKKTARRPTMLAPIRSKGA